MNLMSVIWNEANHKEKSKYHILTCIYGICKSGINKPICARNRDADTDNRLADMEVGKEGRIN